VLRKPSYQAVFPRRPTVRVTQKGADAIPHTQVDGQPSRYGIVTAKSARRTGDAG
jgi:hypothetical protein